jgi:hypothetical protein
MDVNSLGRIHFDWMVTHMADMTIKYALSKESTANRYAWGKMIAPKSSFLPKGLGVKKEVG